MFQIIKENIAFRQQTIKLAKSTLIKTYKGAALGPLWALIKPLITVFVFYFAISIGLRKGGPVTLNHITQPFGLWLVCGMLPWFFISEAIPGGASCIRANKHFITRLPFPMSTIVPMTMLSKLFVHWGLAVILYILFLCTGHMPSIYHLQYFFYMPMMFIFFTALSYITAPLSTISIDFQNVVKSIMNAIFWLSGIIYNANAIQNPLLRKMVLANPVNYFVNGFRYTFLYERWFWETKGETLVFLGLLLFCIVVGAFVYHRLRKQIPDIL